MEFVDSLFGLFGKKEKEEQEFEERLLSEVAQRECADVLKGLGQTEKGWHAHDARKLLHKNGLNSIVKEESHKDLKRIVRIFANPLVVLLLVLAGISAATGQFTTAIVIGVMILLSTVLNYFQETKANLAADKLKAMVQTTATVVREGVEKEIPISHVVAGDIVVLSAGDIVPADLRLIHAKDIFVNQSTLTGESVPVEKHADVEKKRPVLEYENICFMGTSIASGIGLGVVVATGKKTYFGSIATGVEKETKSEFEKGINGFTWLMIKLILIMAPLVLLLNGIKSGNWLEAFLFALSVVVGLAPELLPMIITANLAKGAIEMAKKKVIVKKLDSIQNLGAMDVLCTDKTGTLTQGKVVLVKHLGLDGKESKKALEYAYLNSYHHTGLRNITDDAILTHEHMESELEIAKNYKKIDEIVFDFERRRMSVVLEKGNEHIFICKGAVEEVFAVCKRGEERGGKSFPLKGAHLSKMKKMVDEMNDEGFRVIAVAYKNVDGKKKAYSKNDERDLTLVGFMAFLDPPKESAMFVIAALQKYGVAVKVLTGDNEIITRKICAEVHLPLDKILLGPQIEEMDEEELGRAAEKATVFAKLSPAQKERIISALRRRGHTVGHLGDGINDAPAMNAADVGISVDSAADIAKETSHIILLEKDLLVIKDGVVEGRRVFANIDKYIKMAASSNFGNMFSVLFASVWLPFLPMLPIQVLVNNVMYDMSQITIPTDNVDKEWLQKPKKWTVEHLKKFIFFMGPASTVFDLVTFAILIYVFGAWTNPELFHTGWFIESLLTQTLVIHIIRTDKIPFLESRASNALIFSSIAICCIGLWLPFSPFASALGFVPLPLEFIVLMVLVLLLYFSLAQAVKVAIFKKADEALVN